MQDGTHLYVGLEILGRLHLGRKGDCAGLGVARREVHKADVRSSAVKAAALVRIAFVPGVRVADQDWRRGVARQMRTRRDQRRRGDHPRKGQRRESHVQHVEALGW
jgi:hypothetical protein